MWEKIGNFGSVVLWRSLLSHVHRQGFTLFVKICLPPIECKYVTEECIREWKNESSNFKVQNPVILARFLYELCWTMVRGELPFQKFTQIAQDITMSAEHHGCLIKMVMVNTCLLYQQTKFYLLWEESEGYAKLFHASQVLGLKFQFYQRMDVNHPVPFGLYRLAAMLGKEEFIDLDCMVHEDGAWVLICCSVFTMSRFVGLICVVDCLICCEQTWLLRMEGFYQLRV
ncbi:hypothetical protein NE237_006171 [Protea cynaroides]|uniref:Uncharacterized protein n=1 Tax=Protea cynaroides TaxID=273540 RepID=A0A9Q0KLV5_9MAGN|nr:hypothetical protein NE237_006171 [Protea cynaroides]